MWPSVAVVVEARLLGSAYGLTTAIQNTGLASVPLIVGAIHDHTGTYTSSEIFLAATAVIGVVVGLLLNIVDRRFGGGALNASRKQRLLDLDGLRDPLLPYAIEDGAEPVGVFCPSATVSKVSADTCSDMA
jgi:hypothetical protein